ncbi:pentatricopeptide repeat-containing protein At1g26900, mitochondrial-like [Vigna umbellata]|uniref:pentatricopeptide repeat-containing protein At1g26900, mitochondrial-like n=1 Tax=Vigna umbellata TaxID=87088 RepID=UPI001F5F1755|nr:pentatricopeptide repeat-containing protein At1g26900, mitochondrial-like [Vigna umbellata]
MLSVEELAGSLEAHEQQRRTLFESLDQYFRQNLTCREVFGILKAEVLLEEELWTRRVAKHAKLPSLDVELPSKSLEIGDGSTEEYLHSSVESLEELMENSDSFMEIADRPSVNELWSGERGTTLFDMHAKCGKIDEAVVVFNSMDGKNLQFCTVKMTVLADYGRHKDVISLFNHMEDMGLQPESLVFAVILLACSHAGLVCEGRRYFDRMVRMYSIKRSVEHYGCMVDLLGRSGLIQEAYDIIKGTPMEPNGVILRSFLAACRDHGWVPSLDADLLSELEHELGAAAIDPDGPILSADDLADQIA